MSKTAKIVIGVVVVAILAYVGYKWYTSNATPIVQAAPAGNIS
jgi:predicted negative regulator of RcsB-dependent stress response